MSEIWRKVKDKDVENYEVSDKGRVRNRKTGRILKLHARAEDGYLQVCLHNNGYQYIKPVHVLVGRTFLEPYDRQENSEAIVIGFLDGDNSNVCSDNLAYMTKSEVIRRSFTLGRSQHNCRRVRCVNTGEEFISISECCRATGISRRVITRLINNPSLQTRDGLRFEPAD